MLVISFLALIVALIYIVNHKYNSKINRALSKLPAQKNKFSIRSLWDLNGFTLKNALEKGDEMSKVLGDVFLVNVHPFFRGFIVVTDPKIAQAISFHQPDRYESDTYKQLNAWLGREAFFLGSNDKLKDRKKIISEYLSPKLLPKYVDQLNIKVNEIMQSKDFSGAKVDYFRLTRLISLDMGFDLLFQYNLNTISGFNKEYSDSLEEYFELFTKIENFIMIKSSFLYRITPLYYKTKRISKVLHELPLKLIRKRRIEIQNSEAKLLPVDYFLKTAVNGKYLSDEEICFEMNGAILGLNDTTRTTTGYCIFNLAKHPSIQERVYNEVNSMLKGDSSSIDLNDLKMLKYTEAVINETMRLFAPVPLVARKLDSELKVGDYTFPTGIDIMISLYSMCRHEKHFENALEFNPERFLDGKTLPLAFVPFSIGARKCLGGKLGMAMVKISVAKMIMQYKISLPDDFIEPGVFTDPFLSPSRDIFFIIKKREFKCIKGLNE